VAISPRADCFWLPASCHVRYLAGLHILTLKIEVTLDLVPAFLAGPAELSRLNRAYRGDVERRDGAMKAFERELTGRLADGQRLNCCLDLPIYENLAVSRFSA
jgi:hypothetical protein